MCVVRAAKRDFGSPVWTRFELSRRKTVALEPGQVVFVQQLRLRLTLSIQPGHPARRHLELCRGWRAKCKSDTECGIIVIVAGGKALQKMRTNRIGWRIEEL